VQRGYKEDNLSKNSSVGMEPPFREYLSPEEEKWPLLEAVTRICLLKTLQAGKDLACTLVKCKVWKLTLAL
jgi:hypothetical protein